MKVVINQMTRFITIMILTLCMLVSITGAVSASEETPAGALPDKKDSTGTEDKGHKGSKWKAGEEILEKAAEILGLDLA